MTTDFRALAAELLAWAERTSAHYVVPPHVILRARAALSAQEQGASVMEIVELADQIEDEGLGQVDLVRRALARWGRPAVEPVPVSEWHEDIGDVLWWRFPIEEPPYVGSPLDTDWPGHHTHFTLLPVPQEGADG